MIFLKNGTYIHPETLEFTKTGIVVTKGNSGTIQFTNTAPENAKIIDCTGQYITKSFVIGHHHAYSALATGMPAPKKAPANFKEILEQIWWKLDKNLDPDIIKASAYITAINAALNGTSFIIDHHASPFAIENSLDIIAKTFDEVGISHLLCYEISDRDGEKITQKGIEETNKYLAKKQGLVGVHASFTVKNKTLTKIADIVEKYNSGIHIHAAEDKIDQKQCSEKYGKRVIERLNDFGFLNSTKTIIAHAIHINNKEREILQNAKAYIVQNPLSNLNNKVGFFSAKKLNPSKILLGTDGMHSDMIRATQTLYFIGKMFDNLPPDTIYKTLRNNNKYIKTNKFYGDAENNLIVLNYKPHTNFNSENFIGHFFYSINSKSINHLISNGEIIMYNKKLTKIDENAVLKYAKEQSKRLWAKM